MKSTETWDSIDYSDILSDLNAAIEQEGLLPDANLYIVRQNTEVRISGTSTITYPIVDYFFEDPKLNANLTTMSVLELKKLLYETSSKTTVFNKTSLIEALIETTDLMIETVSAYTKLNSKRNNELVKVVLTSESNDCPSVPWMFFLKDDDVKDELEVITVKEVMDELMSFSTNS